MAYISDTFLVNGAPTNGATVKLWPITSFTTAPAQDTALPSGSPAHGPVTTSTNYGGAGAWAIDAQPGEYWVSIEYGGHIGWGHAVAGAGVDAHANLLVNPNFQHWQRGTSGFNTNGVYTADQWILYFGSGSLSVARSTTADVGQYSLLATGVSPGTSPRLQQAIEGYRDLRGKTVSLSVRVKTSNADHVRVSIYDSENGYRYSDYHQGGDDWETLTVAGAVIDADATFVAVEINFATAVFQVYVDNAMLVLGGAPAAFAPLPAPDDLARCLRYAQLLPSFAFVGSANGAHAIGQWVPLVPMGGTPTVTKAGTWAVTNCGQPAVSDEAAHGFLLSATATGAGAVVFETNGADDYILATWNP